MCPKMASLLHVIFSDQVFKRVPQVFVRFSGFRIEKYMWLQARWEICQRLPNSTCSLAEPCDSSGRGAGERPAFLEALTSNV
jgi:hypothetical protein